MNKSIRKIAFRILDIPVSILAALAAIPARLCWQTNRSAMPCTVAAQRRFNVHCMRNHYYEPKVDYSEDPIDEMPRDLPAIDFNHANQRSTLRLIDRSQDSYKEVQSPNAGMFGNIDSRVLFGMVKNLSPKRIVEVGCGHSTMVIQSAVGEEPLDHLCIEPYECEWLDKMHNVRVIRKRVQDAPNWSFFELQANDILFIDSSHVIRPDGDVLFELNHLLPWLASGVVVHVHDIFTPFNYPKKWAVDELRLWNEQYMLEAFLSNNSEWEILLANNYMKNFTKEMQEYPWAKAEETPGSIWLRKK